MIMRGQRTEMLHVSLHPGKIKRSQCWTLLTSWAIYHHLSILYSSPVPTHRSRDYRLVGIFRVTSRYSDAANFQYTTTSREVEGRSKCWWQGAKPTDHLVAGLACGPYRHCARELGADPDPTHFDPSALVVGGAGSGPLDQRNRWRGRQREWADWRFPVRTV